MQNMKKRLGVLLGISALMLGMFGGCQNKGGAENTEVRIFYSSLESSDYHMNLAEMVKNKAKLDGIQLDVESAEASVETQAEHIKEAIGQANRITENSESVAGGAKELIASAEELATQVEVFKIS